MAPSASVLVYEGTSARVLVVEGMVRSACLFVVEGMTSSVSVLVVEGRVPSASVLVDGWRVHVSGGFVGGRGDGAFGGCVGGRRGDAVGEFVVGQGVVTFVGETSPLLSGVEGEGANVTSEVEGLEACAETLVSERELSEAVALPFIPRGRSVACHECGRPSVRLKLDGRLYKHKVPGMAGVCQASGRLPTLVEASVSAPAGANLFSQPDSHAPNVIQQAMPPIFLDRILGRVGFLRPIRRIPKAARSAVGVLLTSTIHRVCNNTEDEDAWFDLFSFHAGEGVIPPGRKSACSPASSWP